MVQVYYQQFMLKYVNNVNLLITYLTFRGDMFVI